LLPWDRKAKLARARAAADVAHLLENAAEPYRVARDLQRQAIDEGEARHWSRVAVGIAQATGRQIGLDTATRYSLEADFSGAPEERSETSSPPRHSMPDISGDELVALELKRLFQEERMLFFYRLQFLGPSDGPQTNIVGEREIRASSIASAVKEMTIEWPREALSARLVDLDGAVLWERSRHG